MRIVYVIEKISGVGGMERIVADKINYLAEHTAHEIVLLLLWHDDGEIVYPISERVRIVRLNVPYVRGGFTYPLLLWRYNSMMKRLQPDVVDLIWIAAGFMGVFAKRPHRKDGSRSRLIYELHRSVQSVRYLWMHRLLARRADAFVTLTETDAAAFDTPSAICIPNYCSITPTTISDTTSTVAVSLGRDSIEKDFPRMRRLFAEAQKTHPQWSLAIHHDTQDVVSAYTAGSIFLLTSRYEGFSLTLTEAMTCGLPAIAFDCPNGPRSIIEDGKTGFLIPMNDDAAFVERLEYLMDNPDVRRQMGAAARESVKRFNKTEIMNRWLKTFSTKDE